MNFFYAFYNHPCLMDGKPEDFDQYITHFPTGFNQFRKFLQRGDICFKKAKRVYKKTSLSVKSDKSVFWRFLT